jgi:ribosomal protein L24
MTIELNASVVVTEGNLEGTRGVVVAMDRGWVTVEHATGENKFRIKALVLDETQGDEDDLLDMPEGEIDYADLDVPPADMEDDEEEELSEADKMTKTLAHYKKSYQKAMTSNGRKSHKSAASVVGRFMEARDHAFVAQACAILLAEIQGGEGDSDTLKFYHQYAHLNNGQMRMNSGNRINAAVKRGDLTEDDVADFMDSVARGNVEIISADVLDAEFRPDRIVK